MFILPTPGSMPPNSKTLLEEGAAIVAFKLVRDGQFQEEGITQILLQPQTIPGNSGTVRSSLFFMGEMIGGCLCVNLFRQHPRTTKLVTYTSHPFLYCCVIHLYYVEEP